MPRGILVRTAIAAFLVVGVITGILLVRTSNRFYAHTGAMNVPVDPGRPIYLSVRISYEGPVGVDVDSIEAIEENHERYVARFLSPGEGVSVTPFPNMTSITWPVKFKRQRMVNVVFVMDDLPAMFALLWYASPIESWVCGSNGLVMSIIDSYEIRKKPEGLGASNSMSSFRVWKGTREGSA